MFGSSSRLSGRCGYNEHWSMSIESWVLQCDSCDGPNGSLKRIKVGPLTLGLAMLLSTVGIKMTGRKWRNQGKYPKTRAPSTYARRKWPPIFACQSKGGFSRLISPIPLSNRGDSLARASSVLEQARNAFLGVDHLSHRLL